jgi:hypothetical protein
LENPADVGSRGSHSHELKENDLWWNGPERYHVPASQWPERTVFEQEDEIPELKSTLPTVLATVTANSYVHRFERWSTYQRVIRVTAYILRLAQIIKTKRKYGTQPLTATELQRASTLCTKLVQEQEFAPEISELTAGSMPKRFQSLTPFLDKDGLIRVGGRLTNAKLTPSARHPALLPQKGHFTELVCSYYHRLHFHAGPRATQAAILNKYWILSMRYAVRKSTRSCHRCRLLTAKPLQPLMASLPEQRVNPSRPFSSVGVDYAGPFVTKASHLKSAKTYKGYLCIFVCMAVKAVHLEYVTDLSTEAFLAAYNRFTARRGLPSDVYSDNGTNFVGAARTLREVHAHLLTANEDIFTALAKQDTNWHFNPPSAPNFGGLWEAAVKSAKTLLHRTLGDSAFTYEEFSTFFCRIEAILNSRPLLEFSTDPTEALNMLTPGHFLTGAALLAPPEPVLSDRVSYKNRWTRLTQLARSFWKTWSTEYLHTQAQRQKWLTDTPPLHTDQIVYITGNTTSPLNWPLGRITALHPGPDGKTRVATLRTRKGELQRPINRLVPLPFS